MTYKNKKGRQLKKPSESSLFPSLDRVGEALHTGEIVRRPWNRDEIFYRRFGRGDTKVLLIIGLAAAHEAWGPQINGLTGVCEPNDHEEATTAAAACKCFGEMKQAAGGIEVCCFDNCGMGQSSVPSRKFEYSMAIMARDGLALLNHLGWKKAHVFNHSMGAMIACKLAAMSPERILSLALLNATGGGFECFPKGTHTTALSANQPN